MRLSLVTDSTSVVVDVEQLNLAPIDGLPFYPPLYDLVVDGELVQTVEQPLGAIYDATLDATVAEGPGAVVEFLGLPSGLKRVEVWFPARSRVCVRRVRVDPGASCSRGDEAGPRWVVHGSSITHCGEALSPSRTWPALAARLSGAHLTSLGFGGNCLLEQWAARTIRDLPADRIVLELGVNVWNFAAMRERAFVPAVHGFLDTVRDGHPDTLITVVSPILCPPGEDTPGPSVLLPEGVWAAQPPTDDSPGSLSIGRIRKLLEEAVAMRQGQGEKRIEYLDGRVLLGPEDVALLPDLLHPSGEGYVVMGERFAAH